MKIYRRLSQFGSKLAIILQEPLRSTVPSVPSCVTREKYFTARCAKPLQAVAAHLTAVYHSCAGYSIVKILFFFDSIDEEDEDEEENEDKINPFMKYEKIFVEL